MTKKEHFKLMFDSLTLIHKGVRLNKVLCSLLMWRAGGNKLAFGNVRCFFRFFRRFDVSELKTSKFNSILITFGFYPSRKDHLELMNNIAKKLGDNITYVNTSRWNCHRITISPINILRGISAGLLHMKGTNLNMIDKLRLSAQICFYLNTIDAISKIDFSNVKKFLCLANSLDLENLMTQYLHEKGVKTYSLMEGVYTIKNSEMPITNIAFENLTSDIQLCWGQYSKEEFIKFGYEPRRIEVAGYPKEVAGKQMKKGNTFSKGVVLLSEYIMEKQNRILINLLANFSDRQEFYLKLHPSLDYEEYSRLAAAKGMRIIPKDKTINECVDNTTFDFAIAINSTAYYEALMRGLPCFRYFDGSYTPMAGCDDEFSDKKTYLNLIDRIKTKPHEEYQIEVDKALEYAIGWGIDNYCAIIQGGANT